MVEAEEKPIVTITGVTGFVGSMTCRAFLEDGGFRVRGTVRSVTNEKRIGPLRENLGELFNQLELVVADLMDDQSLISAVQGSTFVVHTASPCFDTEDES